MSSVLVHNPSAGTVRAKPKKVDKISLKLTNALVEGVQCHAGSPCSSLYGSLEEEFSQFEKLISKISDDRRSGQKCSSANVILACSLIKAIGPQAETNFKNQLDQYFVEIRDAGRDSNIEEIARLHLLEVIELRANKWHQNENIAAYYREKIANLKLEESESTPVTTPLAYSVQTPPSQPLTPLMSNTPILLPGEVLKNSGKYSVPSKIPGKNYLKDEVVIRNADSGKVMGIKGRRVHLIEEISETIISFQRVPAGAKERLVQITGPAEENIDKAKELITEVIRRNASPVRTEGLMTQTRADSTSSVSSTGLDDGANGKVKNEEGSVEYRYTVTVGGKSVKIMGTDFEMVQTSKLVLDEYYKMLYEGVDDFSRSPSPYGDIMGISAAREPSPPTAVKSVPPPMPAQPPTPVPEVAPSPRPAIMASDLPKVPPSTALGSILAVLPPTTTSPTRQRRVYSRQFLLLCAESVLSKRKPYDFETIEDSYPDILRTVVKFFDGINYLDVKDRINYPEDVSEIEESTPVVEV